MSRLLRALDRHWFEPGSLRDLAIVRIVVAATAWVLILPKTGRYTLQLADASDSLFHPLPALKLLLLPLGWGARPPDGLLVAILVLAHVAAVLAIVGLASQLSVGVLAYCVTLLVAFTYSFGELHHGQALVVVILWVLALVPVGRTLSLDAVLRRWREVRRTGEFLPRPAADDLSIHARWPLRLGQWLLAIAYFSAAASKLQSGNFDWMNGATLAYYLAYDGLMWDRPLGVLFAQAGGLMVALSVFTVLFEGTFWVAAVAKRTTWLYVALGLGMHLGIYFLQRAPFFTFMALYVVFLPQLRGNVAALRRALGRRRATPAPADRTAIVYDGLCPLCIRSMVVVDELVGARRVEYIDLEREWPRALERAPQLTRDDVMAAMHVVTPQGRVFRGFDGFRALAVASPVLLPLAPVLYVPPVPPVGRGIYGWIAARRPRRLCRDVCEL